MQIHIFWPLGFICERENFVPTSSINIFWNINFMAVVLPSRQQYESTAKAPKGCSTAGAARNTAGVLDEHS